MDRRQHSFDTFALLRAAMEGDEEDVREALQAGADVNAADANGRTSLTSAITGESWQTIHASDASFMSESRLNVLKALVGHQDISLYTLNAPQECMGGVSPLGMCAWLNMPTAVEVLLRCSAGRISVDGTDSLGATPLMYAARDGNLAVVKHLLDHGARPDLRDINHWTAIQYALRHSETLWICEVTLRQARRCQNCHSSHNPLTATNDDIFTRGSIPFPLLDSFPASLFPLFTRHDTSSVTHQLIQAIVSSDMTFLRSLLCPAPSSQSPVLVNKPDGSGWSPIHHCVAMKRPSTEAVDALYQAGADVGLFTALEHYTPLHCLARREYTSTHSLYLFTVHLIQDLHAPLNAKDRDDETCIHIAAEHGECIDVLMAFLDCDKNCAVRNSPNSRGLTALEVAKPQFRSALETDRCIPRPRSSVSMRTIRPSISLPFLSPLHEPGSSIKPAHDVPSSLSSLTDFDVTSSSNSLVDNLRFISAELRHHTQSTRLDAIQDVLNETRLTSHKILSYFRTLIEEARKALGDARATFGRVDGFWSVVSHMAETRLKNGRTVDENRLFELIRARRLTRDSADSQATAVSVSSDSGSTSLKPGSIPELETYVTVAQYKDASIATEPPLLDTVPHATLAEVRLWPVWLESLIPSSESTTHLHHFGNHEHTGHHIFARPRKEGSRPSTPRKDAFKSILAGRKKEETSVQESGDEKLAKWGHDATAKNGASSGSSRFKTWLKKKIVPDHRPLKFEVALDIDEEKCPIGREVKSANELVAPPPPTKSPIDNALAEIPLDPTLRERVIALVAAGRDLDSIEECMTTAEQFIATAYRSISRADHISQRVLRVREQAIHNLRIRYAQGLASPETEISTFLRTPDSSSLYDYSGYPSSPPSSAVSSIYSAQHSSASLPSTPTDTEDEDTRALRGLLLRKIETRLDGSFEEIDKATLWLRIVKEVVRGVKMRTGL